MITGSRRIVEFLALVFAAGCTTASRSAHQELYRPRIGEPQAIAAPGTAWVRSQVTEICEYPADRSRPFEIVGPDSSGAHAMALRALGPAATAMQLVEYQSSAAGYLFRFAVPGPDVLDGSMHLLVRRFAPCVVLIGV